MRYMRAQHISFGFWNFSVCRENVIVEFAIRPYSVVFIKQTNGSDYQFIATVMCNQIGFWIRRGDSL